MADRLYGGHYDPCLLVFIPLCSYLLRKVGRTMTCFWSVVGAKGERMHMIIYIYTYMTIVCMTNSSLARTLSPLLVLKKPAAMLWAAYGEGHLGKELRTAFGWEPARNWGPQSSSLQRMKGCQQTCEVGSRCDRSPGWHLDCSFLVPEAGHLTKLCPDSWPTESVI